MLIKCPECNREISDQAYSCPFCGYPIKDKKKTTTSHSTKKSFTVAYRSGPGSIIAAIVVIAIFDLLCFVGSVFCFVASTDKYSAGLTAPAFILLIFGIILLITVIVYCGYFSKNNRLQSYHFNITLRW